MANVRKRQIVRAYRMMNLCLLRRIPRWYHFWKMLNGRNRFPINPLKTGRMKGRTDLDGYRSTFATIDEWVR